MVNDDCIFCKIASGEIPSTKVYEDKNFIGFLDANPRVEGHTLIVSKQHFNNLLDLPISLGNEMLDAIKKISADLINSGKAEGFNVISNNFEIAGQLVPHAHIHIIPRKKDDGLMIG